MTAKIRVRLTPEARRQQLLTTARDMIVSEGLQRFTIEALSRTAGVTSPLIYNYYSSRELLLQSLLAQEFRSYTIVLAAEVAEVDGFEAVARVFITTHFDHLAPGNILPILLSQPEIVSSIQVELEEQYQQMAQFLVDITAKSFKLSKVDARLLVRISSGASAAAAEHHSLGKVGRKKAIDSALSFILAGIDSIANQKK